MLRVGGTLLPIGLFVLLQAFPALGDPLNVNGVFNQREVRGPSSIHGLPSDTIVFGATDVLPNGSVSGGTTATFQQFNTDTNSLFTGQVAFTPFSAFPNGFGALVPFQPGLSGSCASISRTASI